MLHLCTTTTAAAAATTTTKNLSDLLTRDSQYYTGFHPDTGKKLLLKGDTCIETVREGQKYFTNITSYRKIWLLCVKLSKLQNKFGQKYKLYLLISFLNNLISFFVLCLMIISHERSSK